MNKKSKNIPAQQMLAKETIAETLEQQNISLQPVAERDTQPGEKYWKRMMLVLLVLFALALLLTFIFSYYSTEEIGTGLQFAYDNIDTGFAIMVLAGFMAQLVDGALGMGYGLTSATILLSSGASIPAISASIHTAEVFASGASGYSHYKFGNVNKKLFKVLVIPGVIGAVAGAVLLSVYGDIYAGWLRPLLACYTGFLGVKILINAFRKRQQKKKFKRHGALAGAGGFLDSVGGGGWGPIVTTTLISTGRNPKYVIGSVSLTEFFVTLASALSFFIMMGVSHWKVIIALIIGSLIAAPLAAKLAGKLPRKTSFILLGILVIVWSGKILIGLL